MLKLGVGRKISFVPGIGINVITPMSAAAVTGWWLSGGISAADVAGVWQAKGAASLAASYLRLAGDQGYANIDPAVVGGVAPTWNAATGWIGNGIDSNLRTGIVPSQSWSVICRFSDSSSIASYRAMFGCRSVESASRRFALTPYRSALNVNAYNDTLVVAGGGISSGTMAIVGPKLYINGIYAADMTWTGPSTYQNLHLFAEGPGGTAYPWGGKYSIYRGL